MDAFLEMEYEDRSSGSFTSDPEDYPDRGDYDHYDDGPWNSRCVCCGSSFAIDPGDQAEVVNRTTGARGVAHAECYLNETDTYELA